MSIKRVEKLIRDKEKELTELNIIKEELLELKRLNVVTAYIYYHDIDGNGSIICKDNLTNIYKINYKMLTKLIEDYFRIADKVIIYLTIDEST